MDNNYGNDYSNNNGEEKRKVGRPEKINPEMMEMLKRTYSGTRANKRHLQNHYYQIFSVGPILRYNAEFPIDNFKFLYENDVYFKQTIFTELGRTAQMLGEIFTEEEAEKYIIDLAIEICALAKKEKLTSRFVERLIREDREELRNKIKTNRME